MKLTYLIALFVFSSLILSGCANGPEGPIVTGNTAANVRNFVNNIEPGIKPASAAACSLVLSFAVTPSDRAEVKNDLWVVCSIVQAISPTTPQTPGDLSKAIQAALPSSSQYKSLADSIAGGYAIALPFMKGDPKLFATVISDIAGGCNEVAGTP